MNAPQPPVIHYIPGISTPPRQNRNGLVWSIILGVPLFIVVVGGGAMYLHVQADRAARMQAIEERLIQKRVNEETVLRDAIRDQRAILGMTRYEVLMIKGRPEMVQKGVDLPMPHRKLGGVENWLWEWDNSVRGILFDMDGYVITSYDVPDEPGPRDQVRRFR